MPSAPVRSSTTSPPCARSASRAIARPRPAPPRRVLTPKGWNSFARTEAGRPGPSSARVITVAASSRTARIVIWRAPASNALRSRLVSARPSWMRSASTPSSGGKIWCTLAARRPAVPIASSTSPASVSGTRSSAGRPSRAKSTVLRASSAARPMASTSIGAARRTLGSGLRSSRSATSSAVARMLFRSWLILATAAPRAASRDCCHIAPRSSWRMCANSRAATPISSPRPIPGSGGEGDSGASRKAPMALVRRRTGRTISRWMARNTRMPVMAETTRPTTAMVRANSRRSRAMPCWPITASTVLPSVAGWIRCTGRGRSCITSRAVSCRFGIVQNGRRRSASASATTCSTGGISAMVPPLASVTRRLMYSPSRRSWSWVCGCSVPSAASTTSSATRAFSCSRSWRRCASTGSSSSASDASTKAAVSSSRRAESPRNRARSEVGPAPVMPERLAQSVRNLAFA